MKKLFGIIAILFITTIAVSCNDGKGDSFTGVVTWKWSDIPEQGQTAILLSGIDTSQVIYWDSLNGNQRMVFLLLQRDSATPYRITQ